jgi:anti-sigma factor RsiW
MSCRELFDLVTDYLEGALSRRDRARFERHLAGCPNCPAYLDQMRQTLTALGHLDEEALEPDAVDALIHAFRDWTADRT